MRIAIHAADLDHDRIDGTRVYILNMLKFFGELGKEHEFIIYHRGDFNPKLTPPFFDNYKIKKIPFPFFWTQLRFAWEIFCDKPDVLWMPMHNIPFLKRKKLKVVVTIHDLAFNIFPEYFPKKDLFRLNNNTQRAINNSSRIISVSQSTKNDILKLYPNIKNEKVEVVYHGFDRGMYERKILAEEFEEILESYNLVSNSYLLYVGAIQPRKDLITLISAFEKVKKSHPEMKLVFAGAPAWHAEGVLQKISDSPYSDDIIITGTVGFEKLSVFYQNASVFIFPSLYEGFGIPVLEAMASGTPAILADNSSLLEIGGDAVLFFKTSDTNDLEEKINKVLSGCDLRNSLIEKGIEYARSFSWKKSAKETLDILSN